MAFEGNTASSMILDNLPPTQQQSSHDDHRSSPVTGERTSDSGTVQMTNMNDRQLQTQQQGLQNALRQGSPSTNASSTNHRACCDPNCPWRWMFVVVVAVLLLLGLLYWFNVMR